MDPEPSLSSDLSLWDVFLNMNDNSNNNNNHNHNKGDGGNHAIIVRRFQLNLANGLQINSRMIVKFSSKKNIEW